MNISQSSNSTPITPKQLLIAFIGFVIANIIAGYGVVILGVDIPGIYMALNKPSFAPPTWAFGVVWTFNNILVIYGILRTYNLPTSKLKINLLGVQSIIVANYLVFQYLSFGGEKIFGRIIPAMFFLPTFSMLILTVIAMIYSYKLDTQNQSITKSILSGKSIFATYWSLFGWLIIACAIGLHIWIYS